MREFSAQNGSANEAPTSYPEAAEPNLPSELFGRIVRFFRGQEHPTTEDAADISADIIEDSELDDQ